MDVDAETIRRLEEHGAQGLEAFLTADPSAGGQVDTVEDAKVFRWRAVPIELFNHAVGLGNDKEPDEASVDRILDLYRIEGLACFVQLSPLANTDLIGSMLSDRGLQRHPNWEVLALTRETAQPALVAPPIFVEAVTDQTLSAFVEVVKKAFSTTDVIDMTMRNMFGASGIECFLARYDTEPAGVGMLFNKNGVAGLWTGGVLEEFRRRGLHSALISARLRRALDQGADLVFSETEEVGGQSTRDLERQGFFTAYEVMNWHMDSASP